LIGDSWRIPPRFSFIPPLRAPSDVDPGPTAVRDGLARTLRWSYTGWKSGIEIPIL
jgi:hypothetical protein